LWNQQRVLIRSGGGTHPAILPRAQNISGIRKERREPDRSGGLIHLTVGERELSGVPIHCSVSQHQIEWEPFRLGLPAGLRREPSIEIEVFLLAHREVNFDWIYGRNCGDWSGGRTDQRADLLLRNSSDTINRRGEPRKAEIQVGVCHGGGSGYDGRVGSLNLGP